MRITTSLCILVLLWPSLNAHKYQPGLSMTLHGQLSVGDIFRTGLDVFDDHIYTFNKRQNHIDLGVALRRDVVRDKSDSSLFGQYTFCLGKWDFSLAGVLCEQEKAAAHKQQGGGVSVGARPQAVLLDHFRACYSFAHRTGKIVPAVIGSFAQQYLGGQLYVQQRCGRLARGTLFYDSVYEGSAYFSKKRFVGSHLGTTQALRWKVNRVHFCIGLDSKLLLPARVYSDSAQSKEKWPMWQTLFASVYGEAGQTKIGFRIGVGLDCLWDKQRKMPLFLGAQG